MRMFPFIAKTRETRLYNSLCLRFPQMLGTNPQSINSAYKLNGYTSTNSKNSQAIASFLKLV